MSLLLSSSAHYIGLIIDIIVCIVLVVFAFIGLYKGFLKSLLALFSTTLLLIIAFHFANDFANLINSAFNFTNMLARRLAPTIAGLGEAYKMIIPSGMSGSQFYDSYISSSNTNGVLKKFFKFALKGFSAEEIEGLQACDVISGGVATIIMTVISGLLLFILLKIVFKLLSRLFENISRSQVLGTVNKLLGFLFGLVKGLTIVFAFVCLTIFATFVPSVNKKIYPLVQDNTHVVKVMYNMTDNLVEKYFVKSDRISKWINKLWDTRYLDKADTDNTKTLQLSSFSQVGDSYVANYSNETITTSKQNYKLDKISSISSEKVTLTIELTYESEDDVIFKLFNENSLETELSKAEVSTTKIITYDNIDYANYIIQMNTTNNSINIDFTITITPKI